MSDGFANDLTVIIAGRNEEWHAQTVADVFSNMRADTEVIAICDGGLPPNTGITYHPKLKIVETRTPIGQRAATNLGAAMSRAKYIMKLDAHCRVDEGFDVKMLELMQPEYTMVPQMYRLHVYDWVCIHCGWGQYQGSKPVKCEDCGASEESDFFKKLVWEPKWSVGPSVSWRIDGTLRMQYWMNHKKRKSVRRQIEAGLVETPICVGCCFLMERDRFWELGGMDEGHGSWGQYGCELGMKAWLSGGKLVTNTKTWFAHLFRTGNFAVNGESTFPYPLNGKDQERARDYSRDFWMNNRWEKQIYPLSWLLEKFDMPDWDAEAIQLQKERESLEMVHAD